MLHPEFNKVNYLKETGLPVSDDVITTVSRSFEARIELNDRMKIQLRGGSIFVPKYTLRAEHLLVGLSRDGVTGRYLRELGVNTVGIIEAVLSYKHPRLVFFEDSNIRPNFFNGMNAEADWALIRAAEEAKILKHEEVQPAHLLLATTYEPKEEFRGIVASLGFTVEKLREYSYARIATTP
jgi:hypothetical protein